MVAAVAGEPEARVDTIGVAFPIEALESLSVMVAAGWTADGVSAVTGEGSEGSGGTGPLGYTARYRRTLPGGGFVATGKGEMAWVEASLPKRAGKWESVGLDEARGLVDELVREACQFVTPTAGRGVVGTGGRRTEEQISVDDPKIVRLDLVREFQLLTPDHLPALLDGLAAVPQPGRVKVRRFTDAATGRPETLRIGPKAWGVTLYDKHAETVGAGVDDPAPRGALRAEFRLHNDQLTSRFAREHGGLIGRLDDVTEAKVCELRRAWWDRVGAGREVASDDAVAHAVLSRTDWTEEDRWGLLGWLWAHTAGYHRSNRVTERHYRALAATLDLTPAARGLPAGVARLRLDYTAGHELVALAAA